LKEKIKNRTDILSHGDVDSRKIVLDVAEKTLRRLDSYERLKSIMRMDGDILSIGVRRWNLSKKRNVYLVGAGKACNHMAKAVDEIVGARLTRGIVIVKIREKTDVFNKTEIYVGGHPLPNEEGLKACGKILEIVNNAVPDDLFIGVVSGGSSALMSYPIEGISLEDEITATDVLLKSGADIFEINAVRRHISQFNGGMLAKRIASRGAELIGLGISDAIASPPTENINIPYTKYRATPFGPDQTTLDDARNVIHNYKLENRLPANIVSYLLNAGNEGETPKSFPQNTYFLINTLPDSCIYAKEIAEEMGIRTMILTSFLSGEAREVGAVLASIAREIQTYGNPIPAPCLVLMSGEATTKIPDNRFIRGHGGPSQEETLSFALAAKKIKGVCLLSIDSEGTDGTTDVAGGIVDSQSCMAMTEKKVDIYDALDGHASYEALKMANDIVFTGNTGTNLCDFNIMYIPRIEG
jgi:glycerate 2-kinase